LPFSLCPLPSLPPPLSQDQLPTLSHRAKATFFPPQPSFLPFLPCLFSLPSSPQKSPGAARGWREPPSFFHPALFSFFFPLPAGSQRNVEQGNTSRPFSFFRNPSLLFFPFPLFLGGHWKNKARLRSPFPSPLCPFPPLSLSPSPLGSPPRPTVTVR